MLKRFLFMYALFLTFSMADTFYQNDSLRYLNMLYQPSYCRPVVDEKTKKQLLELKQELTALKMENQRLAKVIDGLNNARVEADKIKSPERLHAIAKLKKALHQGR
jgi:hypothetical protein